MLNIAGEGSRDDDRGLSLFLRHPQAQHERGRDAVNFAYNAMRLGSYANAHGV